ncbi:MAG: protein BatD [Myxococcales bacterium]|nr:protein BatD [Myxococcales bacterium]
MSRTTRRQVLTGLAGCAGLLVARTARADDKVTVVTELDRLATTVGEGVEFTVQVSREGDGRSVPDPVMPNFTEMGLALAGPPASFRSSSSSFNFGGGASSMVTRTIQTYTYTLIPSKPGRFALPVHVMNGTTKVAAARTPVLEVTGDAAAEAVAVAASSAGPTEAAGEIFLWTRLDKSKAYVGEQLLYTLEVYERLAFPNFQLRTVPGFQDFWTEELPEGDIRIETVAEVPYRVRPGLRRALFPQRAGTLQISPAEVNVGMRRRVAGRPTTVEVLPLPAEGRPAGFSVNNVGNYSINATVDRPKIKQGEPFTLTVVISGTGNIRVIDPGAWPELDGLRRYDPKVETRPAVGLQVGGEQRYEFLIIPEKAGDLQIPAHSFSFFDPATARYQTVKTKPIALAVAPDADAPPPPSKQGETTAPEVANHEHDGLLAPLITPETLPRTTSESSWLGPGRFTTGMVLAPVAFAAIAGGRALWRRLGPDDASREAAARAAKEKELVAQAERGVASGEGFHGALAGLLQGAAAHRAGPEGQGLPRRALIDLLARRGVHEEDRERLGRLLDRCDAARFGAAASETADQRRAALDEGLALIRKSSLARKGAA